MGGSEKRFTLGDESYYALVELSPDAIFVHKDGRLLFCNKAGLAFAGAGSLDDIVGRPIEAFFPPEQHGILARRIEEMLVTGKPAPRFEFTVKRIDGTVITMESSAAPIAAFGGTAILVVARDVTARKRAEDALRESEANARILLQRIGESRRMLEAQNKLIRRVAAGESVRAIFEAACENVEATISGSRAAVFLLEDGGNLLRIVAAPSLPKTFWRNCERVPVNAAEVPCGLAAETGRPVVIEDFSREMRWPSYVTRLDRYGLQAEWVVPMFSAERRLLGTLVVYHRVPAAPTHETLAFLEEVGDTLGVALQKQQIERRFGETRELHRVVVDGLAEGVMVIDRNHRVLMSNPAALRILRLQGMPLEGQVIEPRRLFKATVDEHGESVPFERWAYVQALETGQPQLNVPMGVIASDGELVWVSINAMPMRGNDESAPDVVVVSFEDITGIRDAENRLHFLANHDPLTQLPNRAYLNEYMNRAIERARRWGLNLGVLFIDLDRFKSVNDNLGHSAGDQLLREVALRLQGCMRQSDIVVRHGGDEFVVVTEELSGNETLATVAERIIEVLCKPFSIAGHEVFLGASVGIAVHPLDGGDSQSLLRNADVAMYHAKAAGGSAYEFFTSTLNDNSRRRFALEPSLRRALERGEFELAFQPRARVSDGVVVGVEALLRWNSGEHGAVAPKDFVPLLEHSGLIVPVGRWVLSQACRAAAGWSAMGFGELNIAVNVSARQLRTPSLVDDVAAALKDSGIAPHRLELELTESMLTRDTKEIGELFDALKRLGLRIAIDDFGTGYSSLAYLSRFPIDILKIDQSFTAGVPDSTHATEITQTIIAMARALGMDVVAEGVEMPSQLEFLKSRSCGEFQGYLLSRPISGAELESFLRAPGRGRLAGAG